MLLDWVVFAAGVAVVVFVLDAAIRTFVVPRGQQVMLTWIVFRSVRRFLELFARPAKGYAQRDRIMAFYAPLALLALPVVSLLLVFAAFTGMYEASTHAGWEQALTESGSSLLTLGFFRPEHLGPTFLAFAEAAIGLGLLALLIAYLPTIYGAFSRREVMVTDLAVRAGTPATPWEMLERAFRAGFLDEMDDFWKTWTIWFSELSETHTSLSSLAFFRSPNPDRSWITASGAVLDSAALRMSALDLPFSSAGGLCIRSGSVALRDIGGLFGFEYDPDPRPDDPICIAREEFDEALDRLAAAGVPLKPDRDQAWRDFAGWRVNYDALLTALAALVMAPYGPWTSDRSPRTPLPQVTPWRRRARRLRSAGRRSTAN